MKSLRAVARTLAVLAVVGTAGADYVRARENPQETPGSASAKAVPQGVLPQGVLPQGVLPQGVLPQTVLWEYLRALYSRDAEAGYALLASSDQLAKTLEEVAHETSAFRGPALVVARALADRIKFENIHTKIEDDQAVVRFDVILPNANDPKIQEVAFDFDPDRLAQLSRAQLQARVSRIRAMAAEGKLPQLRSTGESWELVREDDGWRVLQNWAQAVEVKFEAVTFHDLGWQFTPVRKRVLAKHGETIQMAYRAKNLGAHTTTGKARHLIGPDQNSEYLEIVGCFCFLEQTLAPGEEVELPLVFRVDYDAPVDVERFTVKYELYPVDAFPVGADEQKPRG